MLCWRVICHVVACVKESVKQILLLSVLGCVPLAGLLVLPVMVGGFVDDLGFSERDAGLLASASFLGAALAALVLAFRIGHLNLRHVAMGGLLLMALTDGTCIFADRLTIEALAVLRFFSGVGSAGVYGAVMGGFAGFRQPDRAYGLFMACQFALSAVALYILPGLMPRLGATGLFAVFMAYDLLAIVLVRFLTAEQDRTRSTQTPELEWRIILAPAALLCLAAYGAFEAVMMGQFAYVERFGVLLDLNSEQLGQALGLASLVGVPAALSVTFLGSRFGQFAPIASVAIVQALCAQWLIRAEAFPAYLVIVCVFGAGWAFVLPYFQGIAARLDRSGSVVVAGGFATGAAGFAGPAIAAMLVRPGDYSLLLNVISAGLLLVVVLAWRVTRRIKLDKITANTVDNPGTL